MQPAAQSTPPAVDIDALSGIAHGLHEDGVYDPHAEGARHFRIGAAPFALSTSEMDFLGQLGDHLLAFYQALNALVKKARKGRAPAFVADWLFAGKPEEVLRLARMGRFKNHLPGIIRPDVLFTDAGPRITELDSVPGGMGLTDALNTRYAAAGFDVVGGADGMAAGMERMLRQAAQVADPTVALVVSDESEAYRPEMRHLAHRLCARGLNIRVIQPEAIAFAENGLSFADDGARIDVLYRFFELFDLPNIPKAELMLYAAKKGTVVLTPPAKPELEEKLAMALFHHPALSVFWRETLGEERFHLLADLFPHTWVLDPAPVPGHAVIPGLAVDGVPVQTWQTLATLGQKARQFVVKPSGFSETAWGSRGVAVGHDMSEENWAEALQGALAAFPHSPHVLQPFHKARKDKAVWIKDGKPTHMRGRARLCPYYFVGDERAELGGILATVCPEDKKRLHGMTDAVNVPCGVTKSSS